MFSMTDACWSEAPDVGEIVDHYIADHCGPWAILGAIVVLAGATAVFVGLTVPAIIGTVAGGSVAALFTGIAISGSFMAMIGAALLVFATMCRASWNNFRDDCREWTGN